MNIAHTNKLWLPVHLTRLRTFQRININKFNDISYEKKLNLRIHIDIPHRVLDDRYTGSIPLRCSAYCYNLQDDSKLL
jgi:hypothetical protein